MTTSAISRLVAELDHGKVLDVTIETLVFRAYVVVSPPDIERVADFVPESQFAQDGDVHVTAVSYPGEAASQLEDIAFNMNQGDTAVFLCGNDAACEAMLCVLNAPGSQPLGETNGDA